MMKLFPPHWGKKRLPFLLFFFLLPNQYKIHHDCSFVAQIISLISRYRKIPLRYPVVCMSSRSYIYDLIPIKHSNPIFPLFVKGVERPRLEYGIFLLNKNIEQLLNEVGLPILDSRGIIQNLLLYIKTCSSLNPFTLNHVTETNF
eukprot:Sdes_comp20100_c0_seq6m13096